MWFGIFCGFWYDEHIQIFNTSEMFIELRFTGAFFIVLVFIYFIFCFCEILIDNSTVCDFICFMWFRRIIASNEMFRFIFFSALLTNNNCWRFFREIDTIIESSRQRSKCVCWCLFLSQLNHTSLDCDSMDFMSLEWRDSWYKQIIRSCQKVTVNF